MNEMEALRRRVEDLLREAQKDEWRRRSAYLAATGRLPDWGRAALSAWQYSAGYAEGLREALAVFPSVKRGAR